MSESIPSGVPIVTRKTRAESTNVETIVGRLRSKRLIIPDYQRDAEQWNARKESLFIESLLNNLTIPAFFFADGSDGAIEVVDGQQRLSTILKYSNNEFSISSDEGIVYLSPQSTQYVGKKFNQLSPSLQNVFNDYPLTIISLPDNLELGTKLEIFRRINEGGTPLTAQDIRLSYYSESKSVYLVRLAGIYANNASANRMIESAAKKGVDDVWAKNIEASNSWRDWWEGKALAKGQTPSEMFLWYLILVHREGLNSLLLNASSMKHLPVSFRGTTEEALDIYCAQLQYTDLHGGTDVFPTCGRGMEEDFDHFAKWIGFILNYGLAGISVDKYKQTALMIAAAVELKVPLDKLSDDAWDAIAQFLKAPRTAGEQWLKDLGGYPEQKGRWGGRKGQKAQCDMAVTLLSRIIERYKYR
ncbi:DUF262 domain-containing protein [Nostoc sp. CHAB 5834]|nr:DUF262 domain-containing protein [Nostoc sp. CHAB 5834]